MTASQLKYNHELANPDSLFFSRNNMKFAGDTMANFGVRQVKKFVDGEPVELWELRRKTPVKCGMKHSFFFDKDFNRVRGMDS